MTEKYRPFQETDKEQVARLYNLNNSRSEQVWCKTTEYTPERVLAHIQKCSYNGEPFTLVHEEDGELVSYYCGWVDDDSVTFDVGVVDIERDGFFDIWRNDTAVLFNTALEQQKPYMRIKISSEENMLVDWIEQEVGMTRMAEGIPMWEAPTQDVLPYIQARLGGKNE